MSVVHVCCNVESYVRALAPSHAWCAASTAAQAIANYAAHPIPQIAVCQFQVLGGQAASLVEFQGALEVTFWLTRQRGVGWSAVVAAHDSPLLRPALRGVAEHEIVFL